MTAPTHLSSVAGPVMALATSRSWTHTIEADATRIVVRGGCIETDGNVWTVTVNGLAMTQVGQSVEDEGGSQYLASIWYRDSPPTGSQTVQVSCTNSNSAGQFGSSTYKDCGSFGTPVTDNGTTGTTSSVVVGSDTNSIVLDAFVNESSAPTGNQTARLTATSDFGYRGQGQDAAGASPNVTMTWSGFDGGTGFAHIGVSMAGTGGGSSIAALMSYMNRQRRR